MMRLFLTIAASKGWIVKMTDIKPAFFQRKVQDRDVYLMPPIEAITWST